MNYSDYRFTLDIQIHQAQVSVPVTLNDTARKLYIGLTDGRKPYTINDGCRAVFAAKKPDGTTILNDCLIEKNTTIVYEFSKNTTNVEGIVNCEVRLYDAVGKELTSPQFLIVVDAKVVRDEEITISESEATAISNILATEQARVVAESARVQAESSRVTAEKLRAAAENVRDSAEEGRGVAESNRVTAENSRASAEVARKNAETSRVTAEAKREETIGGLDNAVDEIIKIQNDMLAGNAESIARAEIIAAINETMLIANDLVTNAPHKALSAAQGVVLKGMMDGTVKSEVGYYNGTNSSTNALSFSFVPKIIFIFENVRYYSGNTNRGSIALGIVLPEKKVIMRHESDNGTTGFTINDSGVTVAVDGLVITLTSNSASSISMPKIFNTKSLPITSGNAGTATEASGYGYWYVALG